MSRRAGSLETLRELNRLRVVEALREQGRASRADIARQTGLSRSTVSSLVAELQSQGLVIEHPDLFLEQPASGRPPVLLSLDRSAGSVLGIAFDHDNLRIAVSDLSRTVLAEDVVEHDVDGDAVGAIAEAGRLVERLLAEAGVERAAVIGAGMGIAGPIDHAHGRVHNTAILPGWRGVPAVARMRDVLGVPVHIDNDTNLGALAEVTFGSARDARNAIFLGVSAGIGAGLILEGRPFRGALGTAGEVGHILVDENGPICRCGNRGCLETYASGPALAELLRRSHGPGLTTREIVERAAAGDLGCARAIEDAGRILGRVTAELCNVLNPETVVVGGDLSRAGDLLLDPLREAVDRYAVAPAAAGVRIVAGVLGDRAGVLGALALAVLQSEHPAARLVPRPGAPVGAAAS
jgi:predicted NBD/HSP70 family sugar kinase